MNKSHKINRNTSKATSFHHAVISGDEKTALGIGTTTKAFNDLVRDSVIFDVLLGVACRNGTIKMALFLLSEQKKVKQSERQKNRSILLAIDASVVHGDMFLYFKNTYSSQFLEYTNNTTMIQNTFHGLIEKDDIEAIERLGKEQKTQLNKKSCLTQALIHNSKQSCDYFLNQMNAGDYSKSELNDKDTLVFIAIEHQRFLMLDQIAKKFNFNLSKDIHASSLSVLIESKMEAVKTFIERYRYCPNKKTMDEYVKYFNHSEEMYQQYRSSKGIYINEVLERHHESWKIFFDAVSVMGEKERLNRTLIATPSTKKRHHKI